VTGGSGPSGAGDADRFEEIYRADHTAAGLPATVAAAGNYLDGIGVPACVAAADRAVAAVTSATSAP
jgi:oxygen-dependent protoporphyrinogen oxidase